MKLIPFYNHNSQTKVAALKTGLMSFRFLDEFVRATKKTEKNSLTHRNCARLTVFYVYAA